MHIILETIVMT